MKILFRDRNQELVEYVKTEAEHMLLHDVSTECGDFFAPLPSGHTSCYFVSPANSFGYMDGGIDRVFCDTIGWYLQSELQDKIKALTKFREVFIGECLTLETKDSVFRVMVSAPTMRLPGPTNQDNIFLATRAAVYESLNQGASLLVIPGMGTGTGRVPYNVAAKAMVAGMISAYHFHQGKKHETSLRPSPFEEW